MEIVTLIISAVVQVALAIGFFIVYNQYQKATKRLAIWNAKLRNSRNRI